MINRRNLLKLGGLGALALGLSPLTNLAQDSRSESRPTTDRKYAVVVSKSTYENKEWRDVVDALQKKYPETRVHIYKENIHELTGAVKTHDPTHIAYVARAEEIAIPNLACDDRVEYNSLEVFEQDLARVNQSGIGRFHQFLYGFGNGYPLAVGGIITGESADDAMKLATAKPMRVKRILAKTMAEEFVALAPECALGFSDGLSPEESGKRSLKRYENKNGVTTRSRTDIAGPDFFEMISKGRPDLVITGGHASDIRWEMGYGYQDDIMRRDSKTGKPVMYDPVEGEVRGDVKGSDQTIFWSPGSCLWTRVKDPSKSLMFSLIRHANDVQHFGAAHVTWHGFVGGGMRDPLVTTKENPTFFEAMNISKVAAEYERNRVQKIAEGRGLGPQLEVFGKTWDKAGFTGIGDPALDARLERVSTYVPELETQVNSSPNGLVISIKSLRDLSGCERPVILNLPRGTAIKNSKGTKGLVYDIVGENRYAVVEVGRELENREGQLKYKMVPVKKGSEFEIVLEK